MALLPPFSVSSLDAAVTNPTAEPPRARTLDPTGEPTAEPTRVPTLEPTGEPNPEPTRVPTLEPNIADELAPNPSEKPMPREEKTSEGPTLSPTLAPSIAPKKMNPVVVTSSATTAFAGGSMVAAGLGGLAGSGGSAMGTGASSVMGLGLEQLATNTQTGAESVVKGISFRPPSIALGFIMMSQLQFLGALSMVSYTTRGPPLQDFVERFRLTNLQWPFPSASFTEDVTACTFSRNERYNSTLEFLGNILLFFGGLLCIFFVHVAVASGMETYMMLKRRAIDLIKTANEQGIPISNLTSMVLSGSSRKRPPMLINSRDIEDIGGSCDGSEDGSKESANGIRDELVDCRDSSSSVWLHFPHLELIFLFFAFQGAVTSEARVIRYTGPDCPSVFFAAMAYLVLYPALMIVVVSRAIFVRVLPESLIEFRHFPSEVGDGNGLLWRIRKGWEEEKSLLAWADRGRWHTVETVDEEQWREGNWFRIGFEPLFVDFTKSGTWFVIFSLFKSAGIACVGALVDDSAWQLLLFCIFHAVSLSVLVMLKPFANTAINTMAMISAAADALTTGLMATSAKGWISSTNTVDFAVMNIQLMVLVVVALPSYVDTAAGIAGHIWRKIQHTREISRNTRNEANEANRQIQAFIRGYIRAMWARKWCTIFCHNIAACAKDTRDVIRKPRERQAGAETGRPLNSRDGGYPRGKHFQHHRPNEGIIGTSRFPELNTCQSEGGGYRNSADSARSGKDVTSSPDTCWRASDHEQTTGEQSDPIPGSDEDEGRRQTCKLATTTSAAEIRKRRWGLQRLLGPTLDNGPRRATGFQPPRKKSEQKRGVVTTDRAKAIEVATEMREHPQGTLAPRRLRLLKCVPIVPETEDLADNTVSSEHAAECSKMVTSRPGESDQIGGAEFLRAMFTTAAPTSGDGATHEVSSLPDIFEDVLVRDDLPRRRTFYRVRSSEENSHAVAGTSENKDDDKTGKLETARTAAEIRQRRWDLESSKKLEGDGDEGVVNGFCSEQEEYAEGVELRTDPVRPPGEALEIPELPEDKLVPSILPDHRLFRFVAGGETLKKTALGLDPTVMEENRTFLASRPSKHDDFAGSELKQGLPNSAELPDSTTRATQDASLRSDIRKGGLISTHLPRRRTFDRERLLDQNRRPAEGTTKNTSHSPTAKRTPADPSFAYIRNPWGLSSFERPTAEGYPHRPAVFHHQPGESAKGDGVINANHEKLGLSASKPNDCNHVKDTEPARESFISAANANGNISAQKISLLPGVPREALDLIDLPRRRTFDLELYTGQQASSGEGTNGATSREQTIQNRNATRPPSMRRRWSIGSVSEPRVEDNPRGNTGFQSRPEEYQDEGGARSAVLVSPLEAASELKVDRKSKPMLGISPPLQKICSAPESDIFTANELSTDPHVEDTQHLSGTEPSKSNLFWSSKVMQSILNGTAPVPVDIPRRTSGSRQLDANLGNIQQQVHSPGDNIQERSSSDPRLQRCYIPLSQQATSFLEKEAKSTNIDLCAIPNVTEEHQLEMKSKKIDSRGRTVNAMTGLRGLGWRRISATPVAVDLPRPLAGNPLDIPYLLHGDSDTPAGDGSGADARHHMHAKLWGSKIRPLHSDLPRYSPTYSSANRGEYNLTSVVLTCSADDEHYGGLNRKKTTDNQLEDLRHSCSGFHRSNEEGSKQRIDRRDRASIGDDIFGAGRDVLKGREARSGRPALVDIPRRRSFHLASPAIERWRHAAVSASDVSIDTHNDGSWSTKDDQDRLDAIFVSEGHHSSAANSPRGFRSTGRPKPTLKLPRHNLSCQHLREINSTLEENVDHETVMNLQNLDIWGLNKPKISGAAPSLRDNARHSLVDQLQSVCHRELLSTSTASGAYVAVEAHDSSTCTSKDETEECQPSEDPATNTSSQCQPQPHH